MRPAAATPSDDWMPVVARALAMSWLLQLLVTAVWLAVPHADDSREAWVVALVVAGGAIYVPGALIRNAPRSRLASNLYAVVGIAHVAALVTVGGGLTSGFELLALWSLPLAVCILPRVDVACQVVAGTLAYTLATVLENHPGDAQPESTMWGFGVFAFATAVVNTGMVGYLHTRLRAVTGDLRHRSEHDPLTGLANRELVAGYTERLADVRTGAAYVIDVDGFKFINDSLGHHAGDQLLALVAERLRSHARAGDLLARPGGDEFLLIASDIDDEETALALGQRLLDVCQDPFELDGEEVDVSVTVGIALLADADTPERALRSADLALYAAKSEQRGTVRMYQTAMREQADTRLTLERHLRRALAHGELDLVYQPIVELDGGTIVGLEALLRWHCPALGDVPPSRFIPVAERTGLILPIGRFVLERAVAQLAAWRAAGHDVGAWVNLSVAQLADERLPDLLADLLSRHDVAGRHVVLELTETALMERAASRPLSMLDRLRATGARLALDDFGTGYSSLSRLGRLQLSAVKVDRSFIAAMDADQSARTIVAAVPQLAGPLAADVVAEGVETADQRRRLVQLGYRYAQGYAFCRPGDVATISALLAGAPASLPAAA